MDMIFADPLDIIIAKITTFIVAGFLIGFALRYLGPPLLIFMINSLASMLNWVTRIIRRLG